MRMSSLARTPGPQPDGQRLRRHPRRELHEAACHADHSIRGNPRTGGVARVREGPSKLPKIPLQRCGVGVARLPHAAEQGVAIDGPGQERARRRAASGVTFVHRGWGFRCRCQWSLLSILGASLYQLPMLT